MRDILLLLLLFLLTNYCARKKMNTIINIFC